MNKELTLNDAVTIAYSLAVKFMQYDQPLAEFKQAKNQTDLGKLESAIGAAFQTYDGKYLIKGFYMRAAALFYYLSKSHALFNGNKRLAVTSLLVFMAKNRKWLSIPREKLLDLSIMIAKRETQEKDIIIEAISGLIKKYAQKW